MGILIFRKADSELYFALSATYVLLRTLYSSQTAYPFRFISSKVVFDQKSLRSAVLPIQRTTAFTLLSFGVCKIEIYPPWLWPISAILLLLMASCFAIWSITFFKSNNIELIVWFSNSPSELPLPRKSNRKTAKPFFAKTLAALTKRAFQTPSELPLQPCTKITTGTLRLLFGVCKMPIICWPALLKMIGVSIKKFSFLLSPKTWFEPIVSPGSFAVLSGVAPQPS